MRAYGLLALLVGAGALVPLTALATGKYPSQGEAYAACKRMTANAAAAWQPMPVSYTHLTLPTKA